MRHLGMRSFVCAAVCLAMATTAMAQGQGQGRGGRGGRGGFGGGAFQVSLSQLVAIEAVQKELKINDDQKAKLAEIREQGRPAGGGFGGGQNQSDEERAKAREEFQKRREEQTKKVEAVLDADQLKRAKEILLQQRGNGALAETEVAKQLALSEDQVAQVKTIQEETGKQMMELGPLFRERDKREEAGKKMAEIRKNADEEYMNVLTDEQKAKFAALKGAKFDLDPSAFFPGGGRGGRNGAGGGGGRRGRGGNTNTSA